MKKVLLTLLGIIIVVGILAGAGFAGYRIGYNRSALASANGTAQLPRLDKDFDRQGMPMHNFNRGFDPHGFGNGFGRNGMMMGHGRGFGLFGPIQSLVHLAVLGLIVWVVYKLWKGSGWTITRQPVQAAKVESQATDPKTE